MANPQLENGYTKIANEILEALCKVTLKTSENQILMVIMRKTYGWQKAKDKISIKQICQLTGLKRRCVIYGLGNLEAKNMIVVQRNKRISDKGKPTNEINLITFQKDYHKWVVQRNSDSYNKMLTRQRLKYKEGGSAKKEGSAKNGSEVVQRMEFEGEIFAPTKETITKENTKERYTPPKTKFKIKTFEEISIDKIDELKADYPKLDFDKEFKKCRDWWYGGSKQLKNPVSALRNWLDKAEKFRQENNPPELSEGQMIKRAYGHHTD